MGRKSDDWGEDWTKVCNENGTIIKAKCDRCTALLSNIGQTARINHRISKCQTNIRKRRRVDGEDDENVMPNGQSTSPMRPSRLGSPRSQKERDEFHEDLVCFLFSNGLNLNLTQSKSLQKLLQKVDSSYTAVPLGMYNEIANNAYRQFRQNLMTDGLLPVLYLKVTGYSGDDNYAVILGLNEKKNYVFIQDAHVGNNNFIKDLQQLCDDAVKRAIFRFKTAVFAVIYDINVNISDRSTITVTKDDVESTVDYFRLKCNSLLINELRNPLTPVDETYFSELKTLEDNVTQNTMGLGLQYLFEAFKNPTLCKNLAFKNTVSKCLNHVSYACNFFYPSLKGEVFESVGLIDAEIIEGIQYEMPAIVVPKSAWDEFREYRKKEKDFKVLFRKLEEGALKEPFWDQAKLYYSSLPKLAVQLEKIPLIPKPIDMKKLIELKDKLPVDHDDPEFKFKPFQMGLIVSECS